MMLGKRLGQGSVIGGAFLVLIIISFYSIFVFSTRNSVISDRIISLQTMKDQEKQEERIDFRYYLDEDPKIETQYLFMINSGGMPVQIIQVINLENLNYTDLKKEEFMVNPGVSLKLDEVFSTLKLNFKENTLVGFLTGRGNMFSVKYIPTVIVPPSYGNLTDALQNMSETLGDFIFDYHSFEWAEMLQEPYEWHNSWEIPEKTWLVFRINLTYYGSNMVLPLISENTHILFSGPENIPIYYIVENTNTYDDVEISAYNSATPISLLNDTSRALYFGSHEPEDLVSPPKKFNSKKLYTGIVVVYDKGRSYSQTYPLIGLKVVP